MFSGHLAHTNLSHNTRISRRVIGSAGENASTISYFQSHDFFQTKSLPVFDKRGKLNSKWLPRVPAGTTLRLLFHLKTRKLVSISKKIALCDGVDPYVMKKREFLTNFALLPNLECHDLSNYVRKRFIVNFGDVNHD